MNTKEIEDKLAEMGLSMTTKFIPWSQSRNSKEKFPSLNWKVTLLKNGKEFLTTDYGAGCGHCPSYSQRETYDSRQMVKLECEEGFKAKSMLSIGYVVADKKFPILPKFADVMYSLSMDAEVLEYDFEDWAGNFGYEADSRKAKKIYNDCMEIALKLNRTLGSEGIAKLREMFQDY